MNLKTKIIRLNSFAERCGMTILEAAELHELANKAAKAEERCCNIPDPDGKLRAKATKTGNAVEEFAAKFGMKTDWPGLYPTFQKDGIDIYLMD